MTDLSKVPALRVVANEPGAAARMPPCNTEVEQALLGAMLVNNGAYERTCEILKPEYFYDPVHGRIFKSIATLIGRGQVADPKAYHGRREPRRRTLTAQQSARSATDRCS
jgi:replicative DNA helicase